MSEYNTGYRKPPRHTRFTKGKSGNPRGRPKKSIQSIIEIFEKELEHKITVKEGDKTSKITKEQAVIRQLINTALKGNVPAARLLLQICRNFEDLAGFIDIPIPKLIINPPQGERPPVPPIHGEENNETSS